MKTNPALLTVGLVQMCCRKAAVVDNLQNMEPIIAEADAREVDILCFPEMCLSGYIDPSRHPQAVLSLDGPAIRAVCAMTRNRSLSVLAGCIEANPRGKPFITQVQVYQGRVTGRYRKCTIKDEETQWFSAGSNVPLFSHKGLPFGIAICADIDNQQVFDRCARQGARIIFELAAPGLYGEQATRDWSAGHTWWQNKCLHQLGRYAKQQGIWIAVATQAGRTVDEDFPGGGYVFAPSGRCLYATPDWRPCLAVITLALETHQVTASCLLQDI